VQFISWGDFTLPFQLGLFLSKHLYMWSFQSGTSNPDGLIRLPGRIPLFIVFGLFGNLAASYFYIFSSLVIAFLAFFFFARHFLHVKKRSVQLIAALFFALNPIFLGNVAKVGLVLAAAMLPLCLLALRATFTQQRLRFLLLYIVCINISFLHPYTLVVNLAVSMCYFAYLVAHNRNFVYKNLVRFFFIGVLGILLNLYFILPTISMGTVSKDVISTNVTPTAADYTALVGISNTGNLFTGFSLSKNVFVDFSFYNDLYQTVYFFGIFAFYVLLLALYVRLEPTFTLGERRRLGIFFGCFLVLVALATVTIAHLDVLIKLLIHMPGGWAFRSPLKWQLYIPLVLFSILAIILNRMPQGRRLRMALAGLLATFVIMNGYIATDVYKKILTPRTPSYFAGLQATDLANKTVLFVNNGNCMSFMRSNPSVTSELNQIMGSQNAQEKHVVEDESEAVTLGSYDYILGCKDHLRQVLTKQYGFVMQQTFVHDIFRLYKNTTPLTPLYTTDHVFAPQDQQARSAPYYFANHTLDQKLITATTQNAQLPTIGLHDIFADLSPASIQRGVITTTVAATTNSRMLYLQPSTAATHFYLNKSANKLAIVTSPTPGFTEHAAPDQPIRLPAGQPLSLTYTNPHFDYKNLIPNASFEDGLWQSKVADCYNYDNQPNIGMRLDQEIKAAGKQSLELDARSHIACTGPSAIDMQPSEHYLLSFDYQNTQGQKTAGYHIRFDDPAQTTIQDRMPARDNQWHTASREITVPSGAHHLWLEFYAYPDSYGRFTAIAHYDQVSLQHIPPTQNQFYMVDKPQVSLQTPQKVSYQLVSPTRKLIHIQGAKLPFYLGMNETYDKLWQIEVQGRTKTPEWPFAKRLLIPEADHLHLDETTNGWYINPGVLCKDTSACRQGASGSYDFDLVVEFVPQRWFYFGLAIGIFAAGISVTYYWYEKRRGNEYWEGLWRWHK